MYGTLVYGPMYAHDVYSQIKGYCRQGCEIQRNDIRLLGPLEQILLAGYVSRCSCLCTIHIRCHTLPLCLHFYVMMHACIRPSPWRMKVYTTGSIICMKDFEPSNLMAFDLLWCKHISHICLYFFHGYGHFANKKAKPLHWQSIKRAMEQFAEDQIQPTTFV